MRIHTKEEGPPTVMTYMKNPNELIVIVSQARVTDMEEDACITLVEYYTSVYIRSARPCFNTSIKVSVSSLVDTTR